MKKSTSRKVFEVCNIILLGLIAFVTLYPLLNQLAISVSSATGILNNKINLIPADFTLVTYRDLVKQTEFWVNYKNTIVYTLLGTAIALSMTTLCAYALSKRRLVGKNVILKIIIFTMFFGAGLIPYYNMMRSLKLVGTIWAIVLPGAIAPYNVLLMKTFFQGMPEELEDAASVDGLGKAGYFFKIALPLSKPIIATITLFVSVGYWNDWFSAMIYFSKSEKYPVTLYLRNAVLGAAMQAQSGQVTGSETKQLSSSVQAASMLLVVIPVLIVYPFVQKYFVKGVMIGSIKG